MPSTESKRAEALALSDQLLSEIELSKIAPIDIARKASRLARLLDDADAMQWLGFEVSGLPRPFTADASLAARRSRRQIQEAPSQARENGPFYATQTLGQLSAEIEAAHSQIAAAADAPVSISSSNPNQFVKAPIGNSAERNAVRNHIAQQQAILDNIVGSMHGYVSERYQELRFGSAVESAFDIVRRDVDASIGDLVPEALPMLSAAFENATSDNSEHWANAAGTCRRLVKAVADALRPPGPDVEGRKMGKSNYVNRLIDWITENSDSDTSAKMVTADLSYLGKRLDAADAAGQKGAHAKVNRFDASRFITGTYLVLGDVLRLMPPKMDKQTPTEEPGGAVPEASSDPPLPEPTS